jgi:hypothetical protein
MSSIIASSYKNTRGMRYGCLETVRWCVGMKRSILTLIKNKFLAADGCGGTGGAENIHPTNNQPTQIV